MLTEDVTNLLASTEIATLLLDRQGLIKRFTPSAGAMFGLASPDTGRAIAEVLGAPLGDALMPDVDQVLSGVTGQAEREIETATGQWYVRRITPYATVRNRPAVGAVITWTDITHVKRLDERARRLAAVVQDSNDAVTIFDRTGHFLAWNKAATTMYGYSETEALRCPCRICFQPAPDRIISTSSSMRSITKRRTRMKRDGWPKMGA